MVRIGISAAWRARNGWIRFELLIVCHDWLLDFSPGSHDIPASEFSRTEIKLKTPLLGGRGLDNDSQ